MRHFLIEILRQALDDAWIGKCHRTIGLREHAHAAKPRQGLVGVDERQTERVGNVLLGERKSKSLVSDQAQRLDALVEADDQRGHPF